MANEISKGLRKMGDKEDARFLQGFFKTGIGQYGERDIFLGIRVPAVRKLAQEYKDLPLKEILSLLKSPFTRNRKPLYQLVKSKILWERRGAVLATFYFIKNNQFDDALKIAKILLNDKEDLIHKATGWMLREVGKRDTPCAMVLPDTFM
ncbi:MAG: DNA alkylation repair protein [Smithella sp.]